MIDVRFRNGRLGDPVNFLLKSSELSFGSEPLAGDLFKAVFDRVNFPVMRLIVEELHVCCCPLHPRL